MGLDRPISLEVSEAHDFVVDSRHDRKNSRSGEHLMSASSIFEIRCPALRGAKVEYRVKIGVFVRSDEGRSFHTFSIAPVVSQLVEMMTT